MTVDIDDSGDLVINCDEQEQAQLKLDRQENSDFGSDVSIRAALEVLVTDHEYEWAEPVYADALTDAPILATFGPERPIGECEDPHCVNVVGRWHDATGVLTTWVVDVDRCWGFVANQLRSPLDDLIESGSCMFQRGY